MKIIILILIAFVGASCAPRQAPAKIEHIAESSTNSYRLDVYEFEGHHYLVVNEGEIMHSLTCPGKHGLGY